MKCLIIAAGRGERLRAKGHPKPLVPVLGVPMIARVIHTAAQAGVDDFFVVTGYEGDQVRAYLDTISRDHGYRITCLENPDWRHENGLSVLRAKGTIREPFLLLMSDHLFDPAILKKLLREGPVDEGVALVVDRRAAPPFVDLRDATKVTLEGERVIRIGKGLTPFDALDTGIFLCTPAIFDALEESVENRGDGTLTGGVRVLAERGKVRAVDADGAFWIDIDDIYALRRAERALLFRLRKPTDGPVARTLNRPVSLWMTRRLVGTSLSPNAITLLSFLISVCAAGFFCLRQTWALVLGGLMAQFASILDGCDGEVARLTYRESEFGRWLDAVLDRYADAFLIGGMTVFTLRAGEGWVALAAGFFALIGSFGVSYTADKYDGLMARRLERARFRVGRDVRIFILFLGAVFLLPAWSLWILAVGMNAEVARRIVLAYRNG